MIVPCLQGLNKSTLLEHAWNKPHWMIVLIVFPLQALLRIEENSRSKNACHFETTIHIPIMFEENPQLNLDLLNQLNLDLLNLGCRKLPLSPWQLCFLRNNGAAYTCPQTKKTRASSTLFPSTIFIFSWTNLRRLVFFLVVPIHECFQSFRDSRKELTKCEIMWSYMKLKVEILNQFGQWSPGALILLMFPDGCWFHIESKQYFGVSMASLSSWNPMKEINAHESKQHLWASTEDDGGWESPRVNFF